MDSRLTAPFRALRIALGLTATLAGLDKFFNILTDWGSYVSPAVANLLPFSVGTLMAAVGVIEIQSTSVAHPPSSRAVTA